MTTGRSTGPRASELASVLAQEGDNVAAMKTLAVLQSAFVNPLPVRLRIRLRSIPLFRELFFWRLKRALRKEHPDLTRSRG